MSYLSYFIFCLFVIPFRGMGKRKYISIVAEEGEKNQPLLLFLIRFVFINIMVREILYISCICTYPH